MAMQMQKRLQGYMEVLCEGVWKVKLTYSGSFSDDQMNSAHGPLFHIFSVPLGLKS